MLIIVTHLSSLNSRLVKNENKQARQLSLWGQCIAGNISGCGLPAGVFMLFPASYFEFQDMLMDSRI